MKKSVALLLFVFALMFMCAFMVSAEEMPLQILVDSTDYYDDISESAWYKSAIDGVVNFGLIDGLSENEFAPDGITDRATLVTALYRMTGGPAVLNETPFVDLTDDWYKDAVAWAYETGVVNGTGATTFSPDAKITREQLATIFYRYMNYMNGDTVSSYNLTSYPDYDKVSTWASEAFSWACSEELISGSKGADGVLRLEPSSGATRAQVSTIVMRFCERYQDMFVAEDNPEEDDKYQNFTYTGTLRYTRRNFGFKGELYALNLRFASNWDVLRNEDKTYSIRIGDTEIGKIYSGNATDTDKWKIVERDEIQVDGICTNKYIEKQGSGITLRFRYRFCYEYDENNCHRIVTMVLDYTQADEATIKTLFDKTILMPATTPQNLGVLSELKDKHILIVGNSFVRTSDIGNILDEMFDKNKKKCKVTAIARNGAAISDYATDESFLSDLRRGSYDAVFMCGMYDDKDVPNIGIIKKACEKSRTELILFPAHNEIPYQISASRTGNSDLVFIDWKNEIDAFITLGKSKWDFCIRDYDKHSNPIAGYVGAHMIYRAIYGELPAKDLTTSIKQSDVDSIIGDYKSKGYVQTLHNIIYFD